MLKAMKIKTLLAAAAMAAAFSTSAGASSTLTASISCPEGISGTLISPVADGAITALTLTQGAATARWSRKMDESMVYEIGDLTIKLGDGSVGIPLLVSEADSDALMSVILNPSRASAMLIKTDEAGGTTEGVAVCKINAMETKDAE